MADSMNSTHSGVFGCVTHSSESGPVAHAEVRLYRTPGGKGQAAESEPVRAQTDSSGRFHFEGKHADGPYKVQCQAFGGVQDEKPITVVSGSAPEVRLDLKLDLTIVLLAYEGERLVPASRAIVGRPVVLRRESPHEAHISAVRFVCPHEVSVAETRPSEVGLIFHRAGRTRVEALAADKGGNGFGGHAEAILNPEIYVMEPDAQTVRGYLGVNLHRTASEPTRDQALWVAIRNRTQAISFNRYRDFINRVLRWEENEHFPEPIERRLKELGTHLHGVGAYQVLKTATEVFLLLECGVRIEVGRHHERAFELEEEARLGERVTPEELASRLKEYLGRREQLPYITRVVEAAFPELERAASENGRILCSRINEPCLLELIWCYWHEEGMLMQSMNAVSQRFQNVRRPGMRDPLSNLEIDPLRPVNNLVWGYIQDEVNRLTVSRRSYEYQHEYGLALYGRAAGNLQAADTRSRFLDAFHNLLYQSSVFFKEDYQTTVIADGFPLLNSLQEVHQILAQGTHNQYCDMPSTARTEMLLAEYMLSRPEIRDFLQSRAMVPYKEAWMPQVDTMKTLQGWSDVTVTHFRDLGVYGEQLLLSIRFGDWLDINDEDSAKNWARYFRAEIYGYLFAYRAATGIDLTNPDTVDSTVPAVLLQRRLAMQQRAR